MKRHLSPTSLVIAALSGFLFTAQGVGAQILSSPIAAKSAPPAGSEAAAIQRLGAFGGQGPGTHGANSPFPPLNVRDDVVPWSVLTSVKTKIEKNRVLPAFNPGQMALNQRTQRIQGFMMPLEPGEKQKHFLLSSVPLSCSFCVAGGPESMVEVRTKTPVRYSMEPLVVEGRFLVLDDDQYGLYYRMTEASNVK